MEYMILIYADERSWAGLDEKQLKAFSETARERRRRRG